jgi:hypothetical protein
MHRFLIAFEKLAITALNLTGIWAFFRMIADAFDLADRDYDWNNPRGSYRYTGAHFVVYGFSLVVCVLALVAGLSASLQGPPPLPAGYHYENFREDSELVGHDILVNSFIGLFRLQLFHDSCKEQLFLSRAAQ